MAGLLYGTTWIKLDEPCLGLFEMNLQSPDSRGFHRYQIIYVMRGDAPAEYRQDMGIATKWTGVDGFRIPGGAFENGKYYVEHSVGELRDIADFLRNDKGLDKRELAGTNNIKLK